MSERKRPGAVLEASMSRLSDQDRIAFLNYLKRKAKADDDAKTLRAIEDYLALKAEQADASDPPEAAL